MRQGPSSLHPEINDTPMSTPGFAAVAVGLEQFLVSLLTPPFVNPERREYSQGEK